MDINKAIDDIERDENEQMYSSRMIDLAEKSFSTVDGTDQGYNTAAAWDPELKAFLDASTLKSLFFSEGWVYIITDLIAQKISAQPLNIMQEELNEDGETVTTVDNENPFNAIIQSPNQWQDYTSWMYNVVVELILEGNAIIWHGRQSGSLTVFPTEMVSIDFNDDGTIKHYVVSTSTADMNAATGQKRLYFDPKEIIHIRRPNPSSLLWGLSPFVPGRKSILADRYSQDYVNQFYQKQATPGLALTMEKNVNEDVALRQLRSFELAYTGRANSRRTMIVPKGVSVQPLSHSIADQRLIELVDKNRETICALLKVPKHELSLQSAGSLGSEEHKVSLKNFWSSTLEPTMKLIAGALTKHFAPFMGENRYFEFDLSEVVALQTDRKEKAELAVTLLNAGWTVNEVRQELYEKEPSTKPDADTPYNLIGKSAVPSFLPFSTQAPAQASGAPIETRDLETAEKSPIGHDKVMNYIAKFDGYLDRVNKQMDAEEEGPGRRLQDFTLGMFVYFAEKAMQVIKESLVEKSMMKKEADIPSVNVLRRRIKKAFEELEEQWTAEYLDTLSATVDTGYDTQLGLVINAQDRDAIIALQARDEAKRFASLEIRGITAFDSITNTHTDRIMREIQEGVKNNLTVDQIANNIANTYRDPEKMRAKARTIARTETLSAISLGQAAAMGNAKEVIGPELRKAWLTANDERVRHTHTDAQEDGAIKTNEEFSNGLQFPRDPSGPPEETINCRCTLVMIPPGAEFDEL